MGTAHRARPAYHPDVESPYSVRYREYAEAIWEIEEEGIPVIQARVADWLGVSRASVNEMVHRMADEGLLDLDDRIRLTEEGRHLSAVIVRRHRLAERFLSDVLRLPWDRVHAEAEVWETTISDQVEEAMWAVMEDPKTCPHGNPIPGAGYKPPRMKPIIEMEVGESMRLERISEELELDAELMGFLDQNGLRPDAKVEFVGRDGQAGVIVLVNGSEVTVGSFAAERLFVSE
jgi:DtxR family transcriptional regulator, Mn-dependent transcriptional regulator